MRLIFVTEAVINNQARLNQFAGWVLRRLESSSGRCRACMQINFILPTVSDCRRRLKDNPVSLRLSLLPALEEVHLSHDGVHQRRIRGADSNKAIIEKPLEKWVGLETKEKNNNLTFNAKVISLATADCSREQSAHSSAVKIAVSSARLCGSRRDSSTSLRARGYWQHRIPAVVFL